jgi:hypothetical protein
MRRTQRQHAPVVHRGSKKRPCKRPSSGGSGGSSSSGLGGSGYLSLRKKSPTLASFTSDQVEIPGQYQANMEPTPSLHTTLSSLDPYYEVVYRPG